jgi:two-component system, cell cycle sensor histidine kinase and response regulator CckA
VEGIPESSSSEKQCQGHETILIVEDERLMLRLLEKVLSRHGYQVLVASDGEQAIEVYRCYKLRIDIVLLDVGLPKITGWHVLLKMKEENPNVRVIIASGYLEPKMKAEMSGAGVRYFVNKPYMLDEVVETIQSLIEKH